MILAISCRVGTGGQLKLGKSSAGGQRCDFHEPGAEV
jgi:hypothetical protein